MSEFGREPEDHAVWREGLTPQEAVDEFVESAQRLGDAVEDGLSEAEQAEADEVRLLAMDKAEASPHPWGDKDVAFTLGLAVVVRGFGKERDRETLRANVEREMQVKFGEDVTVAILTVDGRL